MPHQRSDIVSTLTRGFLAMFLVSGHSFAVRGGEPGRVQHVVIIGVDGLSPDGVMKARTPTLRRLMKEGASTLHGRAVMPTVSAPNWASMIMGAGPEQHGVTSNDWEPAGKHAISPTAVGTGGIFPTIFGLIREQRPGAKIGVFHDWDGFGKLFERKAVDVVEDSKSPVEATEHAVAFLKKAKPALTFIHLDHVDHAGHSHGHGSPQYYASVEEADRLIALVLRGVEEAGIAGSTVVLVTSDHGGIGKKHGGNTMMELEIPWIVHGLGVCRGKDIATPVNTYDTAATTAYLLGITPPKCWIARPVVEAFVSCNGDGSRSR